MNKSKILKRNENQKNNSWKSTVKLKLENSIIEIKISYFMIYFLFVLESKLFNQLLNL